MNDLDDWLNNMGINPSSPTPQPQHIAVDPAVAGGDRTVIGEVHFHMPDGVVDVPIVQEERVQEESHEETPEEDVPYAEILPEPTFFSEEDMDEFFGEDNTPDTPEETSEELLDEDEEGEEFNPESVADREYDIHIEEHEASDLDAEEDSDWDRLAAAGVVNPVNIPHHQMHNAAQIMANTNGDILEEPATTPEASAEGNTPLIPQNSPTLNIDDSTSRFSGAEWYNAVTRKVIIIAGCGGIGSNLAYQIARLKPYKMLLYDDDRVELANMSGQLFKRDDVGKYKTKAVYEMLQAYANAYNVFSMCHKFEVVSPAANIMLCGFDSMKARKTYFNAWRHHVLMLDNEERKNCLFMDGRLTIDTLQVLCFSGDDLYSIQRYEEDYLFDDSEADAVVCSMKQTTYLACMIGSIMTNLFINWVANGEDPIIPYKLPFFTQYEAQHMIFKTIE